MSDHAARTNGRIAATNEDTRRVPRWVDRKAYPFKSLFMATPAGRMHYLDEGKGAVVLFVHGNPSWSFEHRSVIRYLRSTHRCVAPDHIGFGLSDKPYAASYLPQFHAANLKIFIDDLQLKDITLVLHDWGGPIGMSYALEHPENIKSIIVYNSWFWGVRDIKPLRIFSAIVGGPIGRFFCRHFNAFPRLLIPASVGDKSKLRHETLEHFIRPFPTPRSRKGTWVFPKAIIGESKWLNSL